MKKRNFVLKTRIKVVIALVVIGYFSFILIEQEIDLHRQRVRIERLNYEIREVEKQNAGLERMIEYTETPEFIERAAREHFGWVKEGDIKLIEKETENR